MTDVSLAIIEVLWAFRGRAVSCGPQAVEN